MKEMPFTGAKFGYQFVLHSIDDSLSLEWSLNVKSAH